MNLYSINESQALVKCSAISLICFLLLINLDAISQTKAELKTAKKMFEGRWVNKSAKRHLTISFDDDDYATINDWVGKWSDDNTGIDAYKAFLHQGKLVMPEDKIDLRSPYCEIIKQDNVLIYRCREMNTKSKRFVEQYIFTKEKN